jgi:hypothetical protein
VTLRGLFVCEGTSDRPLADHLGGMLRQRGHDVDIATPDFDRIADRVGATVVAKLRAAAEYGGAYDLVIVHRDADGEGVEARRTEITDAAAQVFPVAPVVAVVPVRMTEAWLLLDGNAIRLVAGNPNGRRDLGLPTVRQVERLADPKQRLRETLVMASDSSGRRLDTFKRRFNEHRRLLLERVDLCGPPAALTAVQDLVREVDRAADRLARLG